MNLALGLGLALVAGAGFGWVYFWALRTSVQRLPQQRRAAAWFALALAARLALAAGALVAVARWGNWQALTTALVGFVFARNFLVRRQRAATSKAGIEA